MVNLIHDISVPFTFQSKEERIGDDEGPLECTRYFDCTLEVPIGPHPAGSVFHAIYLYSDGNTQLHHHPDDHGEVAEQENYLWNWPKGFMVKLSAHGNPDFGEEPGKPVAPISDYPVKDFRDAVRLCREYIIKYGVNAGQWTGGDITADDGTPQGRVSYRGQVFDQHDNEIVVGSEWEIDHNDPVVQFSKKVFFGFGHTEKYRAAVDYLRTQHPNSCTMLQAINCIEGAVALGLLSVEEKADVKQVNCIVAASRDDGQSDLFFVKVNCTEEQYTNGAHRLLASSAAKQDGYDPKLVFDEHETAGRNMLHLTNWDAAPLVSVPPESLVVDQDELQKAISDLADSLGVPEDGQEREAFLQGVKDGKEHGPEITTGLTYYDTAVQHAYDVGTYVGAAVWAMNQEPGFVNSDDEDTEYRPLMR